MRYRLYCLLLASTLAAFAQSASTPSTPLTYFLGRGGRTPAPDGGPDSTPIPVRVQAVAAGPGGDIWVVAVAPGNTLPIVNAFQDAFIPGACGPFGECLPSVLARLRADGQGAVFSTYLSGSGPETVSDLAVDSQGNAYLVGSTSSELFPFNRDFPDETSPESRAFVMKFSPQGDLVYAKPLPASLEPWAVAVDRQGAAYIGGGSHGDIEPVGGLGIEPDGAQLLRSEDGGQTWEFRNGGLASSDLMLGVQSLVAARTGDDVRLYALDSQSLYRSDDRGGTWRNFGHPQASEFAYFSGMAVDPTQPQHVFATYGCALHASSDGGATWSRLLDYEPSGRCVSRVALAAGQPQTIYAGDSTTGRDTPGVVSMRRSDDGGQSWSEIPVPAGETLSGVSDIAVDPSDPDIVYASFVAETGAPGVTRDGLLLFRTDNAGESWRRIFTGARGVPLIDPAEPRTVFLIAEFPAGNKLVYRSLDRGETWTSSELPEGAGSIGDVSRLALGAGGLYVTTAEGFLYASSDGGQTWAKTSGPPVPVHYVAADSSRPQTLYVLGGGAAGQGFLMKLNPDASGTEYLTLLGGSGADYVQDLAVDDDGRAYATGLTASTDFPATLPAVSSRTGFEDDAFLTVVSPNADRIEFSTSLGGGGREFTSHIALGKDGGVVLAGLTESIDFPLENPIETQPGGEQSDWIAGFQTQQNRLAFAGYLTPSDTYGPLALAADSEGFAYVGGAGSVVDENGLTQDRDFLMRIDAAGNLTNVDPIAVDVLAVRSAGNIVTAVAGASGIWNVDARLYDIPAIAVSVVDYNADAIANDTTSNTAQPFLRAIVNAADQRGHPLTPATVVSLYGSNLGPATAAAGEPGDGRFPTELAGVRVLFGDRPAALLYVSEGQINAVSPVDLGNRPLVPVRVERDGVSSNVFVLTTDTASPAVFSFDTGQEQYALAVNQDGSINAADNPAPLGSTISIFATGVGAFAPALADGEVTPLEAPFPAATDIAAVGLSPSQITYAGAAPGVVQGVAQINFVVPADGLIGQSYLDIETAGKTSGAVRYWVSP